MRKKIILLAFGITVLAGMACGCSRQTGEKLSAKSPAEEQGVEEQGAGEQAEEPAEEPEETAAGEYLIEVMTEEEPGSAAAQEETSGEEAVPLIIQTESSEVSGSAGESETEVSGENDFPQENPSGEEAADEITIETFRIRGEILGSDESSITVDNQSGVSSPGEMILQIDPESTLVLDAASGLPVEPADASEGLFEAYLGPAMTMSLPPQTTPALVLVNVQEDAAVPVYITADGPVREEDGRKILSSDEGERFVLSDAAEVCPYLTRNIVTAEDIAEGTRCLVWSGEDGSAEKIMLFA